MAQIIRLKGQRAGKRRLTAAQQEILDGIDTSPEIRAILAQEMIDDSERNSRLSNAVERFLIQHLKYSDVTPSRRALARMRDAVLATALLEVATAVKAATNRLKKSMKADE
jgi:protein-disulfide isomerase-like protein with CxxC motif